MTSQQATWTCFRRWPHWRGLRCLRTGTVTQTHALSSPSHPPGERVRFACMTACCLSPLHFSPTSRYGTHWRGRWCKNAVNPIIPVGDKLQGVVQWHGPWLSRTEVFEHATDPVSPAAPSTGSGGSWADASFTPPAPRVFAPLPSFGSHSAALCCSSKRGSWFRR